jgi:transcriptional regulator with XRE-family HTH domain
MRCSLVSNKIIQARERLGLTQQQLAEKLCVTNKAVSKWECGVTLPDISLLVPLCRVLGLTVQELLDEYDGKFGNTPAITCISISKPPLRCRPICLATTWSIPEPASWMVSAPR